VFAYGFPCDRAAVEVWEHDRRLYEVNSYYSLPDDAWQYELVGLTGAPGIGPYLTIVIPDATPEPGPFTMPTQTVVRSFPSPPTG
jgi:hypothetical protein